MKRLLRCGVTFFIAGVVAGLAQLWFTPWDPALFAKIELTLGALFAIIFALWFTRREYHAYKQQENDIRLDE